MQMAWPYLLPRMWDFPGSASLKVKAQVQGPPHHLPLLVSYLFPIPLRYISLSYSLHLFHAQTKINPLSLTAIVTNMNSCPGATTVNYTRHNPIQWFVPVPGDRRVVPFYTDTGLGPWGWQWRDGVRNLVSVPLPSIPITIKALMDDIEKVRTMQVVRVLPSLIQYV